MQIVKSITSDGFQFNGLLSESRNSKKIIIHIHGMAGSILLEEYYPYMHEYYPENGYSFLAGEHRGTGMVTDFIKDDPDSIRGNAFERFEDCVYDIQAWIDFARNKGYEEIWLQAHSLGPSKISYFISQTKNHGIKGLIFISPADMLGLVHDIEGQKDHDKMLPEAKRLISEGKGNTLLEHKLWGNNILSAETYQNFFGENANDAIFNYANESLGWKIVNSINVPVLAITGTMDDAIVSIIDPHQAMKKLEQELIHSPKIKTQVYKGAEHSFKGFGETIVKDVISFVTEF